MFGLLRSRNTKLPDELVAAIQNANIAFRGHHCEEGPRALVWGFLEGRPFHADCQKQIEKRIFRHFDLTAPQMGRAMKLIQARVAEQAKRDGSAARLDGRPRKNWINSWGGRQPWEL